MPASYSKDFRSKVMSHVNKGNSCNSASIKFEGIVKLTNQAYKKAVILNFRQQEALE
ncbi:MAG: hypothetical protein NWS20_01540 [Rickettsiaceae bacterium]|nr:hypothetical protein [Rickettsiaceae bacterium]